MMNHLRLVVTAVTFTCIATSTLRNNFGNLGTVDYQRKDHVQWQPDGSLVISLVYKIPALHVNGNIKTKRKHKFIDCTAIKHLYPESQSGVYTITPKGGKTHSVYCDMVTDGGGWTVFQRRYDGSVDFVNRVWSDFKYGFGKPSGEHWLGNEMLHDITSQGVYELRFDLKDFEANSRYAVYSNFKISSEDDGYRMKYDTYKGDAGDSLYMAKNMMFTTKDKDQDIDAGKNCATDKSHPGAWWHAKCFRAHLNGLYNKTPNISTWKGIIWNKWKGANYSLKATKMMMRRLLKTPKN